MGTASRKLTLFFWGGSQKRYLLIEMIFNTLKEENWYEIVPRMSIFLGTNSNYFCRIPGLKDAPASSQYFLRAEGSKPNADCTARTTFRNARLILLAPTPKKTLAERLHTSPFLFRQWKRCRCMPWWNKSRLLSLNRRLSRTLGKKWALRATAVQQLHNDATNQI